MDMTTWQHVGVNGKVILGTVVSYVPLAGMCVHGRIQDVYEEFDGKKLYLYMAVSLTMLPTMAGGVANVATTWKVTI